MQTLDHRLSVNPDGTFNTANILRIAIVKARHQRNVAIVVDNDGPLSRLCRGPLSTAHADYAARAAEIGKCAQPWTHFLARELKDAWAWAKIVRSQQQRRAV